MNWEDIWNRMLNDESIKQEYKKAFLTNMFKKLCIKMNDDEYFKKHIFTLLRESYSFNDTVSQIFEKEFGYKLDEEECRMVAKYIDAFRKKSDRRKPIPLTTKEKLCREQGHKCALCGSPLGKTMSKIHVDHIVPWILVGDELENNYQCLCETCNECKSDKIDYIFKKYISLD